MEALAVPGMPVTTKAPTSGGTPVTTKAPTGPSVVPSIGSFTEIGCFFDSTTTRVLQGDEKDDGSGMTVKECVDFAKSGGWKFAGVEFGSQCFVGDQLVDSQKANDGDCNQACAGDPTEVCGQGNRITIYQDSSFDSPTVEDVQKALQDFQDAFAAAQDAIGNLQSLVLTAQSSQSSGNARRDISAIVEAIAAVASEGNAVAAALRNLKSVAALAEKVGTIQKSFLDELATLPGARAITSPTGLATIGAFGLFKFISFLSDFITASSGGGASPTEPAQPTTTSETPTGTPSAYVVGWQDSFNLDQFDLTTAQLANGKAKFSDIIRNKDDKFFAFAARLFDAQAESLRQAPLIAYVAADINIPTDGPNLVPLSKREEDLMNEQGQPVPNDEENARDLQNPDTAFFVAGQPEGTNANRGLWPWHLGWMGGLWANIALSGNFLDIATIAYDSQLPNAPRVYLLDTTYDLTHNEFSQIPQGTRSHGTAMLSLINGQISSPAKGMLGVVAIAVGGGVAPNDNDVNNLNMFSTSALQRGINFVLRDQRARGKPLSIVSISTASQAVLFRPDLGNPTQEQIDAADPWKEWISRLLGAKIVPVVAGSNDGTTRPGADIKEYSPIRWGGANVPVVGVGAVGMDGMVSDFTVAKDTSGKELYSIYNIGHFALAPVPNTNTQYTYESGCSVATALVASAMAIDLNQNPTQSRTIAKFQIRQNAATLKGGQWPPADDGNVSAIEIACCSAYTPLLILSLLGV
ncbi:peptidase S8/S53 domain-containing protein [Stachybotrys elegans]|uniref:Peptidase S8/S53 domain-containing protein n=1 Tax=Stachybotrys elegans TaxID=80388 RepID=A0A8K0T7W9_9HYPO|nr:peptidase S8/S53 domain-containing protein [Stachybotrys elegans]